MCKLCKIFIIYEIVDKFFNQIFNILEIYVVFINFGDILYVVFGVNICKYKCIVYNKY